MNRTSRSRPCTGLKAGARATWIATMLAASACSGTQVETDIAPAPPAGSEPAQPQAPETPPVAKAPPATKPPAPAKAKPAAGAAKAPAKPKAPAAAKPNPAPAAPASATPASAKRNIDPGAKRLLAEANRQSTSNKPRAIETLKKTIEQYPNLAVAHYNMAVLYEQAGLYRQADKAYRAAIKADGGYLTAVENLANLALRQRQPAIAEKILLASIRKHPSDLGLRNRLIAIWLSSDKNSAAEAEAKKILKADERNIGALLNLATVFFQRGQFELATSVLDRAREIDPNEAKILINLGFVYLVRGDKRKATEAFRRATDLRADLPEAYNNLGALYVEARDYTGAIKVLKRALELYPKFAKAFVNLGNAYKGNKQYKLAEGAYRSALKYDSTDPTPLYNLAVLYLDNVIEGVDRLKRFDTAKTYFKDFEKRSKGLDRETRQRIAAYRVEADRSRKREERRIKAEERRKKRQRRKKKKANPAAGSDDAGPGAPRRGEG